MNAPLTIATARRLLTSTVRATLERAATCGAVGFTPLAFVDAGVPAELVAAMLARDGDPERARTSLTRRGHEQTTRYVWAPDIRAFLRGWL